MAHVNGVSRVVWKRLIQKDSASAKKAKHGQKYEYIPFLAVSRALGKIQDFPVWVLFVCYLWHTHFSA